MKIEVRYKTLSVAYYAICMLLLTLYQFLEMRTLERGVSQYPGTGMITCFVLLVFACSVFKFYLIPDYKAYKPTKVMVLYVVFWVWILIPTVLNELPDTTMDVIIIFVRKLIPVFSLLLTYNFLRNHGDSNLFGWYFCVSSLLFAVQYFIIMRDLFPEVAHMVVSYYTLYMLPLIFLTSGKKRKVVFVIFTLLVLITSIKRGGLIAMAGGLATYAIVYFVTSSKIKVQTVLSGLIVLIMLIGLFMFMSSRMDAGASNIIERFASVEDDEGSGRTVTWIKTYQMIENSDFEPLMFGHGHNAVERDSQMGWSAHNDFLEVAYDYGLVGLGLYVMAVGALALYVLGHIRRRSKYAMELSFFFAVYMMLSMASHVIIYQWANVVMLTISYIAGKEKLDAVNE